MREAEIPPSRFSPFPSLLLILSLVLLSSAVFGLIGVYLAAWVYDIGSISEFTSGFESQLQHPRALILMQGISAFGTFIIPAWVYARINGQKAVHFFALDRPLSKTLLFLAIATLITAQGPVTLTAWLNQSIHFPSWMGAIGEWLNEMNERVDQGYRIFLDIRTPGRLLIMLLIAGVIPAFGEEFIFRGIIQRIFYRWTGNGHWAVWLGAILFSLIHMQVLNFLPRVLLGALLGYLFLWSGNLWYSIFAHFFNNAVLLIYAFVHLKQGGSLDDLQNNANFEWLPVIVSTLLCMLLLSLFRFYTQKKTVNGT